MPRGAVAHISLVVQDLEGAVEKWSKLLQVLDPDSVVESPVYLHGSPDGVTSDTATFVNPRGVEIQLMCPRNDAARAAFGCGEQGPEFVHHICFVADDVDGAGRELRGKGFRTTAFRFDDDRDDPVPGTGLEGAEWNEWLMVPMDDGKILVEIVHPYKPANGQWEPVENWTPDLQLP
jgi:hypothetical protein